LRKLRLLEHSGFESVEVQENEVSIEPSRLEVWDKNYVKPFFLKETRLDQIVDNQEIELELKSQQEESNK
jgi:hypothetical protein